MPTNDKDETFDWHLHYEIQWAHEEALWFNSLYEKIWEYHNPKEYGTFPSLDDVVDFIDSQLTRLKQIQQVEWEFTLASVEREEREQEEVTAENADPSDSYFFEQDWERD